MKLPRKRWLVLSMPATLIMLVVYGTFLAPPIDRAIYKNKWIERFSEYRGGGAIPAEWKDEVGRRSLPSGEWILAAMHHGSCAPGPEGSFNASVILDSSGAIFYQDWSPCAGGLPSALKFWESGLEPAISLADLHGHRTKWLRAAP